MIKGKILDPIINNLSNYINTSNTITTRDELKAIQRSIAMLRLGIPKIIYNELIRSSK